VITFFYSLQSARLDSLILHFACLINQASTVYNSPPSSNLKFSHSQFFIYYHLSFTIYRLPFTPHRFSSSPFTLYHIPLLFFTLHHSPFTIHSLLFTIYRFYSLASNLKYSYNLAEWFPYFQVYRDSLHLYLGTSNRFTKLITLKQ